MNNRNATPRYLKLNRVGFEEVSETLHLVLAETLERRLHLNFHWPPRQIGKRHIAWQVSWLVTVRFWQVPEAGLFTPFPDTTEYPVG